MMWEKICTLASPKVLSFEKTQIKFGFLLTYSYFGFAESRLHLGNKNKY